jgi:hypothetical protein
MSFKYTITGVPDLDQEWNTLPGLGKNYCVPTSAMNWLYYMAKHGQPGALKFQNSDTSNAVGVWTNLIFMGSYMDTDTGGTSGDDAVDGLVDWLDEQNLPSVVFAECAFDCGDITFGDLEAWTTPPLNGMTVVLRGSFKKSGDEWERTGGHAMTMVGFDKSGSTATITVHNPADDNSNLNTQSAKINQTETLTSEKRNLYGYVNVLRWGTSTDPFQFIEGVLLILPLFAITNPTAKTVIKHTSSASSNAFDSQEYRLPFEGELLDVAIHPLLPTASFIGRGSNDVWALDFRDGSWTKTVSVPSPERLTFGGRDRRLFVLHGGEISGFDKTGKPLGQIRVVEGEGGAIDAMSYDAKNDRLIVAPSSSTRLISVSPALKLLGETQAPEIPGAGRRVLSVNGRDGTIVLSRAGTNKAATLRWHETGAIASGSFHMLGEVPNAVHVDRRGHLYASENGKIATFDMDGNRAKSFLDGLPGGPILKVARSSHNFDPVRSRRKAWKYG